MRARRAWAAVVLLGLAGCGAEEKAPRGTEPPAEGPAAFAVTSPAFKEGEALPAKYTVDGQNVSPPLAWSGAPEGTREFALVCDDPDAPREEPFVHWVVYKIPPACTALAEGDPGGALEGNSDFGRTGYGGPAPPSGVHHYHFKVYALDTQLDLAPGATKAQLLAAMAGHILAEGRLVSTYQRK